MKKRLWAILLMIAMLLMVAPTPVGAAESGTVSLSNYSVCQDQYFGIWIYASDFVDVASLELYIFYDSSVFTLHNTSTSDFLSGCLTSVNDTEEGMIVLSAVSLEGLNGSGGLLYFEMQVAADAQPGQYTIFMTQGDAYDTGLQPCTIATVNGRMTVIEQEYASDYFYLGAYFSQDNLNKGDSVCFYLGNSSAGFVSADFTIRYDPEVLQVDSVEMTNDMLVEGALHSINTSTPGEIRISYASLQPVSMWEMVRVWFTVLAEGDQETVVTASAANVYKENLIPYTPTEVACSLRIWKDYEEVRVRNVYMQLENLRIGQESTARFVLEAGAKVAAADFTITYDPSVLECVGVTAVDNEDPNIWLVVSDNYAEGEIRFSYLNLSGGSEEVPLIEVTFVPRDNPNGNPTISMTGSGVMDLDMNPVELYYPNSYPCILMEESVVEPTCYDWGYTRYYCIYCQGYCDLDYQEPRHQWDEGRVVEPTCYDWGYTEYYCAQCGSYEYRDHTEPGHQWDEGEIIEPTCTSMGYTRYTCIQCMSTYDDNYTSELGHAYTAVVTAPTCTEWGYTTHTCACGDSYVDEYVEPVGHSHAVTETVNATCTEDGYIVYTCHCGDSYTEVVFATGHSYVDGACEHCGEADPNAALMGDVNGDGTVNHLDAMLIAQYYVGDIGDGDIRMDSADVNGDGAINHLDAMLVAQFYVGDIDAFPANQNTDNQTAIEQPDAPAPTKNSTSGGTVCGRRLHRQKQTVISKRSCACVAVSQ